MARSNSRAKIGLGTKITFTESGFVGEIIDQIEGMGFERQTFDATHMDVPPIGEVRTNGQKVFSDLARIKDATMTVHFDPAIGPPPVNEGETIVFQFPRRKTEATAAEWSATGAIVDCGMTIPVEAKMQQRFTVAFTGDYSYKRPTLL